MDMITLTSPALGAGDLGRPPGSTGSSFLEN